MASRFFFTTHVEQDIKCFSLVQAFHFVALKIKLGMIWVHNRVKGSVPNSNKLINK